MVFLESDFPEWLAERARLFAEIDGQMIPWRVTSSRLRQSGLIMSVDALKTRNDVEAARGTPLYVTEQEARDAVDDPDYFFNSDLVGLAMLDARDSLDYGRVVSVVEMPAQNLLEVERTGGATFLFPFTKALIEEIDLETGVIRVRMPDGLMECNEHLSSG